MIDVGTLVMKVDADTKKFSKGLATVNKGMASVGNAVKKVGKTVAIGTAAAGTAAAAIGVKSLQAGAEAEEMLNKYNVVFKGMTDTVDAWAKDYASSVGRSVFDTKEYLSNLADLQQGLGMTGEESFDLSKKIVELGTDLASFNNLQDADAIEALSKAMLGEAESAKQLGLLLNVDRVKDFAEAQGLVYNELTDARKAHLVYELAVSQSQNAIGDAERSSESYTNQMKKLQTGISDASKTMGMKLIPIATDVVEFTNKKILPSLEDWVSKTDGMQEKVIESYDKVRGWWDENGESVKSKANDVFNGIKTVGMDMYESFNTNVIPIIESVKTAIDTNWPAMKTTAKNVYKDIKKVVDPAVTSVSDFIQSILNSSLISNFLLPGIETAFSSSMSVIGSALGPVVELIDKLTEAVDALNESTEEGFIGKINRLLPEGYKIDWKDVFDLEEQLKAIGMISPTGEFGVGGYTTGQKIDWAEILQGMGFVNPQMDLSGIDMSYGSMSGSLSRITGAGGENTYGNTYNVNINGPVSSERDARRTAQITVDELKRRGVKVP